MIRIINSFYLAGQIFRWAWLQCLFVLVFRWVSGFEQLLCPLPLDLQFLCWACFCLFDFVLELVGFVFRFEDFLALCCDCVQHNVLCNESEFSGVCVIQTVGSTVTRQGLNCFLCVSIPENNFWHFVFIQMPGYHVRCTNISLFSIFICHNFGTSHSGSNDNTFLGCSLMLIY